MLLLVRLMGIRSRLDDIFKLLREEDKIQSWERSEIPDVRFKEVGSGFTTSEVETYSRRETEGELYARQESMRATLFSRLVEYADPLDAMMSDLDEEIKILKEKYVKASKANGSPEQSSEDTAGSNGASNGQRDSVRAGVDVLPRRTEVDSGQGEVAENDAGSPRIEGEGCQGDEAS